MASINVPHSIRALRHLPIFSWTYQNEASTDELSDGIESDYPEWQVKNCPTCLEDYQAGDTVAKTSCGHYQHKECFMQDFLIRNDYRCSVCRAELWTPWASRAIDIERYCYTRGMADPDNIVAYWREDVHNQRPAAADIEGPPVVDDYTKRAIAFATMGVDLMCSLYWDAEYYEWLRQDLFIRYALELWNSIYLITACTPGEQDVMASTLEDKVRACIRSAVFPESGIFPWSEAGVTGESSERQCARRIALRNCIGMMIDRAKAERQEAQEEWGTYEEEEEEQELGDEGLEASDDRGIDFGGTTKGNRRSTI